MKENIKKMNDHLKEYENLFYDRVVDIGNSQNECKCEKQEIHFFCNVKEIFSSLCIECGGQINGTIKYLRK